MAVAAQTIVIDGVGYTSGTLRLPPYSGVLTDPSESTSFPKAHLNWAIFDRNDKFLDGGARQLQGGAEDGTDVLFGEINASIDISEPGYVYIWLSNTNAQVIDVYFDDFKVTHTKSPVIQQEEYYPFGLTFNSYQRENSIINNYLFNEKEKQDELNLGWFDFETRMYQPEIGRMLSIDGHAFNYYSTSPYSFVLNNPMLFSDPTGMDTVKQAFIPSPTPVPAPSPPPPTVAPPSTTTPPATITPLITIPSLGSFTGILGLIFMMGGDTPPRFDYNRYTELQDKEDTGTLKEDERQELENMRKKNNNPYEKLSDSRLQSSKESFEKLIQEHLDKIDQTKCDPESYFGDRLKGLTPENRQKLIDGRVNTLKRQLNRQTRELIQIKETIKKR